MDDGRLDSITGEFVEPVREQTFRDQRFHELLRHSRVLFVLSAILNTLFLFSDWRFEGQAHFFEAIYARFAVIVVSLACAAIVNRARHFRAVQAIIIVWQWCTAVGVAVLVSSRSDIALFVVLLLPAIYYLVVPISFRWSVAGGTVCSVLLLAGYLGLPPQSDTAVGLALAVLVMNVALILVLVRNNRQSRLEWAATRDQKAAREVLSQSERLLERTFMAVPIPLLITELESGRILRYNAAGVSYFGGEPHEFGIHSAWQIYADASSRRMFLDRLIRDGSVTNFETRIRLGHGEVRSVLVAATFIEIDGEACLVSGIIDITDRLAAEQKIRHAASHDALTGLTNRAAFQAQLDTTIREARTKAGSIFLLLVDLDGLKDVNDTLGHAAGDALLVETARRLEHLAGEKALVARLGGDEFVILLRGAISLEEAQALSQAIIANFRHPLIYQDRSLSTKASIGLAACPSADYAPGELMKDADLALYAAKQEGRNRAVLYAPAMRRSMNERISLNRSLAAAVANNEITPYYQPKVSLITGQLMGFEALMRWKRSSTQVLQPQSFYTAFEDPELALLMGEAMLRQVARDVRSWLDQGHPVGRVAVNLSPAQFTHRDLARQILDLLEQERVAPGHFDIEITETVFLGRNSDFVAPILGQLHSAGMKLALDDFGTGYAALTHLKQLPIDTIKIDRSFVQDTEIDSFDAAIVCTVIELGKNLGMCVVAEGVETVGQARFLRERGCEVAQGFLYARPMPAAATVDFLARENRDAAAMRICDLWGR
ncbi:EAL domain-containing protein [Xanthobacter sp. DSM 24535]|uniref:putative bifunctional diguanylate cyclase/phosphodiesterase n=1 Tax=Roseixanthobacter psychrophilus TaxID=3119917 RepID=UPI00372C540C